MIFLTPRDANSLSPVPSAGPLPRAPHAATLFSFMDRTKAPIAVTVPQLGDFPNMIQPPLLGVVNAPKCGLRPNTTTCRAPAVPRSCSTQSVYNRRPRAPIPQTSRRLEHSGCGPSHS